MSPEPETTLLRVVLRLYESSLHYLGFILLALSGSIVRTITDLRMKDSKRFRWIPLLLDLIVSAFAGIIVALIGMSYHLDPPLIAALCGVAGHMGARGIFLIQALIIKKLRGYVGESNGNN